jgi:hypothetical protein
LDDELSPRARMLVDVALEEDVPPPSVADGSWEMVVSRLTMEAARSEAPVAPPSQARTRGSIVFVVLGLVVIVAGVLLWLVMQPRPKPTTPNVVAPPPAAAPPPATAPRASERGVAPVDPPAATPSPDDAATAAKLLDEAEAAEPERALELLARHAELAPLGTGADRRMALRIVALCALDRTDDAKADARAFLSRPRDAKWTKRVRESCARP